MRNSTYTLLFLFLTLSTYNFAQIDANLLGKWDYAPSAGAYEKINKVIGCSNGYIVAVGETLVPGQKLKKGLFLLLDEKNGTVRLRKQFGESGDHVFNAVVQNFDGTFSLVGFSKANNRSPKKGWMVQLDLEGNLLFEKTIASTSKGDDEIKDIAINNKGEMLAVGWQNERAAGDVWVLRLDDGELKTRQIGRGELGFVQGIAGGADGSFVLVGSTGKTNKRNYQDAWIMKVDKNGEDRWGGPRYFGGKGNQEGLDITQVQNGGYAFVGFSSTAGLDAADKWLVKIDEQGEKEWDKIIGGHATDIATSVVELSEGGYAIFGQTRSHMPSTKYTAVDLILTDDRGNELDSDNYVIANRGRANEIGHDVVELANGDIVIAASTQPEKSNELPQLLVSASAYKTISPTRRKQVKDLYGSNAAGVIRLTPAGFVDANGNESLELGERGYFRLEATNLSKQNLNNVSGKISSNNNSTSLGYWRTIEVGTIRAGQTKAIIIPVVAKQNLPKGEYNLNVNLETYGSALTSTSLSLNSNQAEPAKLMARGNYSPGKNPKPGETINLNVELVNIGGTASTPVDAHFIIPRGVRSISNEKIRVPGLQPHVPYRLNFSFSYTEAVVGDALDIKMETLGEPSLNILKTFPIEINAASSLRGVARVTDEMLWISHDPDEKGSRNFSVATNEVNIKLKVLSSKELQKRNFSVLVNGRKAQGQKMDEVDLSAPVNEMGRYRQTYLNRLRLKEGANKIRIEYDYGGGKRFLSKELIFNYTNAKRPNLHVISIGVPYEDLKYTSKDAKDFAKLYERLKIDPNGFKEIDVNPFTTKLETQTNTIKEVFEKLSHRSTRIKKEDLLVIYISAHGKVNRFGEFLLKPSDYKADAENTYSINFDNDILKQLRIVDCKKLVFVDACQSGSAFGGKNWNNADAASRVMNDLIKTAPGIEIIASCGTNEFSYEDDKWGNSAFTKAIIEAFNNQTVKVDGEMIKADVFADSEYSIKSGSDGKISIKELKLFIQKRVPYLVKTTKNNPPTGQHPSNKSTELLSENMGIYYLKN